MKDKRLLPPLLTIIGLIMTVLAQRIFTPASVLRLVFLFAAFVIFVISLILLIKFRKRK
ncbi:MAG: hypothetical protein FWF72_01545 [Paludibacter sp.]|nr:hypothetical protein [Paludibacter sp.]